MILNEILPWQLMKSWPGEHSSIGLAKNEIAILYLFDLPRHLIS